MTHSHGWPRVKNSGIELDDLDKTILAYLQRDGRIPYTSIAEVLGVSSGTIRRRAKRLEDEGYLQIVGVADPFRTGIDTVVFFSLKVQRACIKQVMEELSKLDEVYYAAYATGAFDVIGIAMFRSRRDLLRFMDKDLSAVKGIRETDVALLLEIRKQTYDWAPWGENIDNETEKCKSPSTAGGLERQLDEVDKEIIRNLQVDGRCSFAEIAARLHLTERTIRRRTSELRQAGILRIVGVTNPFRVGMNTVAVVGVRVDRQNISEILSRLCSLREIRYVALSTGVYDLIFEAVLPTNSDLKDFLVDRLSQIEGIVQTDTSLVLEIRKQKYSWGTG